MTTTLRKAITALTLLVFLQGGDALKGNGLRRQKHVVAANEPRALVDLFAKGLPKNTQKVTKGKNEDLELDDLLPESTTAPKNVTATEDLEQDDLEQDDLEQDDYPATTEIEDVLDAVDDTTTAPRKGGVKGEKSVDPATTPPQISETPEDNNGTSKGKGKGPKGSGENTTDGGEGDDGSDAIDPTIAPEPTIVPSFENGVVVPEPDDSEILPAQVPGGLVTSAPGTPLTTARELPMFAIRYIVESDGAPNPGDYNELAVVTTEFLDEKFAISFEATPAKHAFTTVDSYKIREPLVVEFHVSSHFYIPGEVPLMSYMYEQLEQQFEAQSQAQDKYLNDLSGMSDTNPFSITQRVEIIDNQPDANSVSEGANLRSGNSDDQKKRTLILAPVIATVTFFVLGLAFCLFFRRSKYDGKAGEDDDSYFGKGMETDNSSREEGTIEEGTYTVEAPAVPNPNGTQYYGDDPETVRYLNSIRESGLEEASKSYCSDALEEVSLDDVSIEDDCSEESEVLDEDNGEEHMVDTSSVTANGDHPSMSDESSTLENRAILSRDGGKEALEGKSEHAVEGNAPLLSQSEIAEQATSVQKLSDHDSREAEQDKNDACSVVCENTELQDEEIHDVLVEEEKNSLSDEKYTSPGNGEVDAEPASTSNAAETTAALPPNDGSTEPVSKNDQDEFNYLHLDSSFEEDLRSIV